MQPTIHWYPGHMAKTKRELTELIRYLDLIIEVRDARIPIASHNSDLDRFLERRPLFVVLNKCDLVSPKDIAAWSDWFVKQGLSMVTMNGRSGEGIAALLRMLTRDSVPGRSVSKRIGVVGIPNVGKSSVLNRLVGGKNARTGNIPGITRGKQWVKRGKLEILDTPGLLPPKIQNPEDGWKLALIGALPEEVIPIYDLALFILNQFGQSLFNWEDAGLQQADGEIRLEWFAGKRQFIKKGGGPDLNRAAVTIVKEFRDGRLGPISLESPPHPNHSNG